jgi:hypothetical protein
MQIAKLAIANEGAKLNNQCRIGHLTIQSQAVKVFDLTVSFSMLILHSTMRG